MNEQEWAGITQTINAYGQYVVRSLNQQLDEYMDQIRRRLTALEKAAGINQPQEWVVKDGDDLQFEEKK